ncbi:MAG: DUF1217 domain-containing protein [Paracoccaceae bacterium]
MTFQPVLPMSGYAGWKFLERTKGSQQTVFNSSAQIKRDTHYFKENIGAITSAEELVSNRRLLSVALGAFGLEDDIGNTFFIKRVLADGTNEDEALANKLADKRYFALSKAFGFGDFSVANSQLSDFSEKIVSAYQTKQFEVAIGNQNENMRLALSVEGELDNLFSKTLSPNATWFQVMGTPALRQVFSEALGMPSSLASLDLDRQLDEFRKRAEKVFGNGDVDQFSDPVKQEKLIRKFIIQAEIGAGKFGTSPGSVALALLQNSFI